MSGITLIQGALKTLNELYPAFMAEGDGKFTWIKTPPEFVAQATEITKQELGDKALPHVHGVVCGEGADGAIVLFTGNTPNSPLRAAFLAHLLSNWPHMSAMLAKHLDHLAAEQAAEDAANVG